MAYKKYRKVIQPSQSNYRPNTHTTKFSKIIFIPPSKFLQQNTE